jgi:hypothetical protein
VDAGELSRIVRFDARRPPVLEAIEDAAGIESTYPIPVADFDLSCLRVGTSACVSRVACGPETLLLLPESSEVRITVTCDGGEVELGRGQATSAEMLPRLCR